MLIKHTQAQKGVLSALYRTLNKHNQPLCHKEIVLNRVNEAFENGASPARGYSVGIKDALFLIKNGVRQ